jgi:hypothetical protein
MQELEENIQDMVITSDEVLKAMDYRQKHMVFTKIKLIQVGGENIDDWIDVIRDDILVKDGIVVPEAQKDFRFFVEKCMTRKMLDQISEDFNSFNKKSYRLEQMNMGNSVDNKAYEKSRDDDDVN